jgi:AraC-like DNA-binding protein
MERALSGTARASVDVRHHRGALRPTRSASRHVFTVLAFQVAGELEVDHGGTFTLREGDVHVIPAGHAHRLVDAADVEVWTVAFAASGLDRERFAPVLVPLEAFTRGGLPRVAIPDERRGFVTALFGELAQERAASPLRGESLLALLLDEVAAHTPQVAPSRFANDRAVDRSDLAARAVSFVATHALGPLTLADVATALGSNRTHVADVVRRATGQTVGEIIAEVRLDEARRRLEDTDELVEVIGERVGYVDPTHFARVFRRRYGVAPRRWRATAERQDR